MSGHIIYDDPMVGVDQKTTPMESRMCMNCKHQIGGNGYCFRHLRPAGFHDYCGKWEQRQEVVK